MTTTEGGQNSIVHQSSKVILYCPTNNITKGGVFAPWARAKILSKNNILENI